jgi:hypothetical protein
VGRKRKRMLKRREIGRKIIRYENRRDDKEEAGVMRNRTRRKQNEE